MTPTERRRRADHAQYGSRYARRYGEPRTCVYCADPGDTLDHCPPISSAYLWDSQPPDLRPDHILVLSCTDCNNRLGSKQLYTLEERAAYLLTTLTALYERKSSLWSEAELSELSPGFRRAIQAKQTQLIGLHTRIRALQLRELTGFDDLN